MIDLVFLDIFDFFGLSDLFCGAKLSVASVLEFIVLTKFIVLLSIWKAELVLLLVSFSLLFVSTNKKNSCAAKLFKKKFVCDFFSAFLFFFSLFFG